MSQNSHLLWVEMVKKKIPLLKAYVQTQDFSFTGLVCLQSYQSA